MHLRTHLSGQISGQIPNQAASQLSNHQLQNGSSIPPSVQTLSGLRNTCSMDPDLEMKRTFVREKIYQKLAQQRPQIEMQPKLREIVKRLEDGLFKSSSSEEEYMNMDTLENRVFTLIRRLPVANHTQQLPNLPASSSHSTMIPTPGIIHSGNINLTVTSSMDSSVNATSGYSALVPNTDNVGNLLPNANGSSAGIYGSSLGASDGNFSSMVPPSVQTLSGLRNTCSMDPDLEMKRTFVREKIYQKLAQQRPQMAIEMQPKLREIVKRLEDCLFKSSSSEEEHMNMDTLENRLFTFIRRLPAANRTQQSPSLVLRGSGSNNGQVSAGMRSTLEQDIISYGFSNMDLNGDDYAMSTVEPSGPGNLYGRNLN